MLLLVVISLEDPFKHTLEGYSLKQRHEHFWNSPKRLQKSPQALLDFTVGDP